MAANQESEYLTNCFTLIQSVVNGSPKQTKTGYEIESDELQVDLKLGIGGPLIIVRHPSLAPQINRGDAHLLYPRVMVEVGNNARRGTVYIKDGRFKDNPLLMIRGGNVDLFSGSSGRAET